MRIYIVKDKEDGELVAICSLQALALAYEDRGGITIDELLVDAPLDSMIRIYIS